MSGALTAQLLLKLSATGSKALDLDTATDPLAVDYSQLFSSGTGANQASNLFHDSRTLAASASETLDLAGVLANAFGVTLTFTKIKALIVHAASGNTNDVVVGGAATNAWVGMFSDATDKVTVKPGGTLVWIAPDANGGAVVASTGDSLQVANGGAGTGVTYDIIVIGVD